MAEIKIEKKKPVWPWILLLLIVAAIVYFAFFREEENVTDTQDTTVVTEETVNSSNNNTSNADIAAYVNFIDENRNEMGLDHEFTNEAFMKLIAATKAAADEVNYDIKKDMDQVEEYADKITNDPYETTHADNIRKAADTLAAILQNIQQRANGDLGSEAAAVKDAAASIEPEQLTLDQKSSVKSFFNEASDLLEKINQ